MIRLDQVENIQEKIYEIYKKQNHGLECYSDEIGDLEKLKEQLEKIEQINFNSSKISDILLQINIKSGKYLGQLQDDNTSFKNAQQICINKFKENNYDDEEHATKNIKYIITQIIKDIEVIKDTPMEELLIDIHNYTITLMILIQNYNRKHLIVPRFSN